MFAEASAALSSLTAIKQLAGLLVDERDRQKAAAIQIDLTNQCEQLRVLEAKQSEQDRYRLAEVGTVGKFFAYALRPPSELAERADEVPHFLCQPCFSSDKKGVLRFLGLYATCPICKTSTQIKPAPPATLLPHRNAGIRRDW